MAVKIFGKKAVFFSFMAIFILIGMMALFSLIFKPNSELLSQSVEENQIMLANSNVEFFKNTYLPNILRVSSRYALASFIQEIYEKENYIIDCFKENNCNDDSEEIELLSEYLVNLMVTGNIEGNSSLEPDGVFKNPDFLRFTLLNQLKEIRTIFEKQFQLELEYFDNDKNEIPKSYFGAYVFNDRLINDILISKINIKQNMAFFVEVDFTLSFNISTKFDKVSWSFYDYNTTVLVPLYGLLDPFYIVEPRMLFGSEYSLNNTLREDSKLNRKRSDFKEIYDSMKYLAAPGLGPSFFQRIVHSHHSSECCGLESLVNLNKILGTEINKNVLPKNWYKRSNIDYMYFYYNISDNKNVFNCEEIVGEDEKQLYYFGGLESPPGNPTYFNLEPFHLQKYNLSGILTSGICQYSWECQNDSRCVPITS